MPVTGKQYLFFGVVSVLCFAATLAFIVIPQRAEAVFGDANKDCTPVIPVCGCGQIMVKGKCVGGANKYMCPCGDSTSGLTSSKGVCMAELKCQGQSSQGLDGAQQALQMAKQIMDMLKGGGGGGGGGETPTNPTGCATYYNVTTPSSTDPCAIYVPNSLSDILGSGGTSNISSLLDALGSGANTNTNATTSVSGTLNTAINPTQTTQNNQQNTAFGATTSTSLSGDVRLGGAGATIVANLKQGISEVAGFFGGSTIGGQQSQSVASRMCASRPWAGSGLIASFVPDIFFDGLCSRTGYQVGQTQMQTTPSTQTTTTTNTNTSQTTQTAATTTPGVNTVPPQVDIWAEPLSVKLGTRAYIFWNSRGVNTCTVSGPSFTQTAISGGASTVAITGATAYSVECTAPDGTKVTDSVTVNLSI